MLINKICTSCSYIANHVLQLLGQEHAFQKTVLLEYIDQYVNKSDNHPIR